MIYHPSILILILPTRRGIEMWNPGEHDGVGRHGDGLRRVHLHRLQPGDAPVGAGGQRPAVQQHHLAPQVPALGRQVVLVSRGTAGRRRRQPGGVGAPELPSVPPRTVLVPVAGEDGSLCH